MGNMNVTVIDQNNVNIAVTPTPTQTINIDRGIIGVSGLSGYSGYSGYSGIGSSGYSGLSGFSGYSGISGWSGESGTSGYSGYSGIGESGYSGFSGYSGDSGISGFSGDSGISGYSGESGISGYSGFSGQQGTSINLKGEVPTVGDLPPTGNQVNDAYIVTEDGNLWVWNGSAWFDAGQIVGPQGLSGFSGYSGESGYSGFSGDSGISGWSGESGISGFSGDSGISGWSGFSGESGYSGLNGDSGYSGISGYSGFSGDSGISGWSGISGYSGSGISGWSGFSGYSGISGQDGASGFSGYSGISGYSGSGISGYSGYSGIGTSGYSGFSGYSGYSGAVGAGGAIGNWGSFWDTTTQTTTINTPTPITFNSYDVNSTGVSIGSPTSRIVFANSGTYSLTFSIQFTNTSTANGSTQIWLKKNGTNIPDTNSHFDVPDKQGSSFSSEILTVNFVFNVTANDYVQLYWDTTNANVSLETIAGNGTYPRTPSVIFTATQVMYGQSGYSGISGYSGYSGFSGISGFSGFSGISGYSGSGVSGWSGASGYSGYSGEVGTSGYSGYSGISGTNGASGFSGISGYSGYSGIDGASGFSGYSGISGYSGSGVSGYSGFSGISGYSGYSGITPTIGGSNTQVQFNNSGVLGGSSSLTWDGSALTTSRLALGGTTLPSAGTAILFSRTSDSNTYLQTGSGNNFIILDGSQNTMASFSPTALSFNISNTNKLTLNSTTLYTASGVNVGIGVSNPTSILQVNGGSATQMDLLVGTTRTGTFYVDSSQMIINAVPNINMYFRTNDTTRMTLDASGNLGLGVTPSGTYKLEVAGTIYTNNGSADNLLSINGDGAIKSGVQFKANGGGPYTTIYFDNSTNNTYYKNLAAGGHLFYNGTTQAMTLDASGNLGVGTTSPSAILHTSISGSGEVGRFATTTDSTPYLSIYSNGSMRARLRASSAETALLSQDALPLIFGTNNTERMRITGTGYVGIGTSTPRGPIDVIGRSYFQASATNVLTLLNSSGGDGSIAVTGTASSMNYSFNTYSTGDALYIQNNGNVGIKTGSPAQPLDVNGNALATQFILRGDDSDIMWSASGSRPLIRGNITNNTLAFYTSSAERMRIDSSGNVGIGNTIPSSFNAGARNLVVGSGSGGQGISIYASTDASLFFAKGTGGSDPYVGFIRYYFATDAMGFYVAGGNEAMRITSSRYLKASNTGTYVTSQSYHELVQSDQNNTAYFANTNASLPYGINVSYRNADPNGTGNDFIYCEGNGTTLRMSVRSNGGIANYTANNVVLSDSREKTNFAPSKSYLDVICAIPVQTFNYIDQNLEEDDGLTLGVTAQDVQSVAPELVSEGNWGTKENPKMRLEIYQTDLQYALMKCIQEQQALIESLTTRLTALENK